jgi:hypothetical protein
LSAVALRYPRLRMRARRLSRPTNVTTAAPVAARKVPKKRGLLAGMKTDRG